MDSKSGYPPQEQQQQPQQQNIYPDVPPVNPPSYEQTVPQPMAATIVHQSKFCDIFFVLIFGELFIYEILAVVQTVPLGPQPANLQCPSCHKQMVSNIKYESATKTHMFALLCCLLL